MPLLEARGLVRQYGRNRVVDGVDLHVRKGEIVGLLGPNGAGKTTTFRMITGMVAPTAGKVFFSDREITDWPMFERARLGLGYLAQEPSVFRKLTVEQNLYAILELITTRRGKHYRPNGRQRRERVEELLAQFGLSKVRRNVAGLCSGGEKRRLEIARCLISDPMLIMLDEPFTGIDPIAVADIQQVVVKLKESGISILITDHHVAETLRITDRSYLVAAGKMLVHGTPREIVSNPDARRLYLGENFHAGALGLADEPAAAAAPPATRSGAGIVGSLRSLLDADEIHAWIDRLADADPAAAENKIRSHGRRAVEPLMQALARSDLKIRSRAHRLLCEALAVDLPFDAAGHEQTRTQQIACLRDYLRERNAA